MPAEVNKRQGLLLPFLVVLLAGVSVSLWGAVRFVAEERLHGDWIPSLWVIASPRPVWVALGLWLLVPLPIALLAGRGKRGAAHATFLRLIGLSSLPIAVGTVALTVLGSWEATSPLGLALWWLAWPAMWLLAYGQGRESARLSQPKAAVAATILTLAILALLVFLELRATRYWLGPEGTGS